MLEATGAFGSMEGCDHPETREEETALLSSGLGEARMALCFLFTSSTFSARDSMNPRISSTYVKKENER